MKMIHYYYFKDFKEDVINPQRLNLFNLVKE